MRKILVIEDEKDIAKAIVTWLEMNDFKAICVHNGRAGVIKAWLHKPSLILLDIKLPKVDGLEVCRILKEDKRTAQIPIIMLTSLDAIGDVEKAFEAGANDYLTKPFEFDRLHGKIKKHLNIY